MTCTWREGWDGNWQTKCGHCFIINEGAPEDNGVVFCCYCGGLIEQISLDVDAEESE